MKQLTPIEICDRYVQGDTGCEFQSDAIGGFCRLPDMFKCPVYEYFFYGQISVSQANIFMKCKKLYQYTYLDGWDVLPLMKPRAMRLGSAIHLTLESILKNTGSIDLNDYFSEDEEKERGIVGIFTDRLSHMDWGSPLSEYRFVLNPIDSPEIHGVIDLLYPDHFSEVKVSARPDYYTSPHFLQSQLATYFMTDEALRYANMMVIRVPELKQGKNESIDGLLNRIDEDIKKRPSHYFTGYDPEKNTFGKRFYRTEFDLPEVLERYRHIMHERRLAIKRKCFYKNESQCLIPTPCQYMSACETGGMSDLIYYRKEVKEE